MTNGNLINDYWVNVLCRAPFDNISISVDAATDKTYRNIRIGGNLNKVIQAIRSINELKNGNRPSIHLSYVVMRRNLHELVQFLELAHQNNVNTISYQTISNQRAFFYSLEKVTHSRKDCEQLLKLSVQLQNLADDYKIKLVNRIPANIMNDNPEFFFNYYNINNNDLNNNGDFKCKASWEKLDISPIFYNTCCFSVPAKHAPIYYNNGDNKKIHEIWNDPIFINARRLMVEGKYNEICRVTCLKFFNYMTNGMI